MAEVEQQVDHRAEALRLLGGLYGDMPLSTEGMQHAALIHSNLAIAEELGESRRLFAELQNRAAEGQERVAEEVKRVADALEAGGLTYADGMARS